VSAKRLALGSTPAVSSKTVAIHFDISLTVTFAAGASALNGASVSALKQLARSLKNGEVLTSTGYARGDAALALRRATSVARYLESLARVHVTLRSVSNGANNKVILSG
jgi:outer membrane protein OmpA-like peptidoglycan-associated protein